MRYPFRVPHVDAASMNTLFFRRAALLSALAFASGSSAAAGTAPEASDATTLAALDRAMQKAVVDRDPVAFASFLTDDYVLVVSTSRMASKAEVVAEIDAPDGRMDVNDSTDLRIRVHGDTALVIADLHQVGRNGDTPFDYWVRYTDTWIRTADGWKCVSGHATRLAR
jgi:ketosteroid isomerase-like protein